MTASNPRPLSADRLDALLVTYRDGLLHDTLPFWLRHAVDREHGGYCFCVDRDGARIDSDKGIWQTGRFIWMLANLCNTVEPRDEWLAAARHGVEFLERHGFDADGKMFFLLAADGRPLRKRRYFFSEAFAAMGYAAFAQATNDACMADRAREVFGALIRGFTEPSAAASKTDPRTRPMKSLSAPMILLCVAQTLRDTIGDDRAQPSIDAAIAELRRDFVKPELGAVLETVGPNGEFLDHFDGRLLNPGHAIEAAWFILHEAERRGGDAELIQLGTTMLDLMWRWGWDDEFGGILYYRDVLGRPIQEYWHDMKFWWPQNEAIIATLLAYQLTGDPKYAVWHTQIHDWAHRHFPDPEHGEWFGYLHRDGRLSTALKGNYWKGPFHLPRMQWRCWQITEKLRAQLGA